MGLAPWVSDGYTEITGSPERALARQGSGAFCSSLGHKVCEAQGGSLSARA